MTLTVPGAYKVHGGAVMSVSPTATPAISARVRTVISAAWIVYVRPFCTVNSKHSVGPRRIEAGTGKRSPFDRIEVGRKDRHHDIAGRGALCIVHHPADDARISCFGAAAGKVGAAQIEKRLQCGCGRNTILSIGYGSLMTNYLVMLLSEFILDRGIN